MIEPYYDDGGITIYCADWRDVLPVMPPKSVDLVLTDPPYEKEAHTKGYRIKQSSGGLERQETPLSFPAISEGERWMVASDLARITRRWVLTFGQMEGMDAWRNAYEAAQLEYVRTCIWVKPDGMPQYSGDRPSHGGYEPFLAMHPYGRKRWNGGGKTAVYTFNKNSGGKHFHETQKPLPLIAQLVLDFSDPGDLVLDCYGGSGTTAVACKILGRRCILVEREERNCEIAARRLMFGDGVVKAAEGQMVLFGAELSA